MKRLAWAGHVVRINSDRTLKKVFSTKLERVRTVGRPKLRWEDGVKEVTKTLGVKNWKTAALERETNGHSFSLRRPGPTKGSGANDEDDDYDNGDDDDENADWHIRLKTTTKSNTAKCSAR